MKIQDKKTGRKHKIIVIGIILFFILNISLWIIPSIVLTNIKKHTELSNSVLNGKSRIYNVFDLYNVINEDLIYDVENIENIVFENNFKINISIENFHESSKYSYKVFINENLYSENILNNGKTSIEIQLKEEGKNNLEIYLYKDNTEKALINKEIYYIIPYENQFLQELENEGTVMHIRDGTRENYKKSIYMYKKLGGNYVREDFLLLDKFLENNDTYYSQYDKWINELNKENINILLVLNGTDKTFAGEDQKINTDEEINKFVEIAKKIAKRYPFIIKFELINEPNTGKAYSTNEDLYYYTTLLINLTNELKKINPNIIVSTGGNTTLKDLTDKSITSEKFIEKVGLLSNKKQLVYAYHPYDNENKKNQNGLFYNKLNSHDEVFNQLGGFAFKYVTEYGVSSNEYYKITEELQAEKIVQQNIILDNNGADLKIQYNFWNTSNDTYYSIRNYGLVHNDYTPKKSYYAMKNYYKNTNGAEYIGTLNNLERITNENIEAHLYDKDGKPKIIVWSNNSGVNTTIPYKNFKATDLYGEEIQPDENGNLVITTSPVYLDEVDYNYFYQAISNVATEKYNEFTEKFAGEIAQIPELTSKIEENQKYMESVGQVENKIVGSATIQAMKNHFELGNLILQAYRDGKLQAEDVKISSMLDMLNDIGDSYEDLVTVSAQTVEQSEIEQTNKVIQEVETTINNNQGCEIIYPVKILDFAKDHYEKATYINSLEGENDIKNGLIISNNLHASLLANWAKEFAQINIDKFVDEYITNNPVTIEYSTTEFTNQNVKATIKTNAEIQITNNSNSKEHTFEQNGSFTFEYTIKGRALNITATVQNIDKVAPSISGVQKAKLYTKPVTPKINDENLKEIKLILNSHVVSNYKNGDTLEEEGFYELTATDKAGNTTTTYFQIFINNDTDYKIEENYIKNVTNNTKKSDFDKKLNLSVDYKIYRNETELKQDDIIATGDILTTEAGDNYTIIVPGDINKDGKVDLKDFIKMRIYLLLENNLDDIEMLAADCNNDNQPIGVKDYIRMRLIILMNDM